MAKIVITDYERHVAAIVEHTLAHCHNTDLTVAEIIDAAHQNDSRKSQNAATRQ